jgi:hypothetical protein
MLSDHPALQSLLQAPSKKSWLALCGILECWDDAASLAAVLSAVDHALQQWPERDMSMLSGWPMPNRIAPPGWARMLKKGRVPQGWSLVQFLQYHDTNLTQAHLQAILQCGQLERLTHLYLGQTRLQPPLASTLAAHAAALPRLEALSLYGNTLRGDATDDFAQALVCQLSYLNLGGCLMRDAEVRPLLQAPLPKLRFLSLSGADLSEDCIDALLSTAHLPALHVLQLNDIHGRGRTRAPAIMAQAMASQGPPHLRRAVFAGQLHQEQPRVLKQRCRDAQIRGFSSLSKHDLIERLLQETWGASPG